jgi:hypothetical protein
MNPEVRAMLDKIFELFKSKFADVTNAWDHFIEFLAVDHNALFFSQVDHRFEWLCQDLEFSEKLIKAYDAKSLRSDYHDHLGDMYENIFQKDWGKREINQQLKTEDYTEQLGKKSGTEGIKILDKAARSGRLLMDVHKRFPGAVLFGVEPDKRLYRIALTNFAIHDIPGYLLNADPDIHELDLKNKNGQDNWSLANLWIPPIIDLKTLPADPNRSQETPKKNE